MRSLASYLTHTLRKWNVPILAVAIGMVMCCSNALAQSGASSIQGTVTDSTGAAIVGAQVHVVNKATNVAADTKSNGVGIYQIPGLVTGTYELTVKAPGMKAHVFTVQLQTAQTAVVNPIMTAGAVAEQVTVQGSIVQLANTNDGALTSILERERIDQLPMNGRLITSLAQMTTPGLESGFGPGTRANGLPNEAMEYVADGAPLDNRQFGGANASQQSQYPDPDAIQEVRIEMNDAGAQYATPATGIITTKSGTNSLHGTAFWTGRNNSALGIAKARSNPSNFAAPNYKRNEFGVSAGGPVILPHVYHGKDKTFWFFAYERYSLIQSQNYLVSVDTPAMMKGDFSALLPGSGIMQLYDPLTTTANSACPRPGVVNGVTLWNGGTPTNNPYCRTPFGNGINKDSGNNQIPVARLNPLSKIIYDMTPTPNIAGVTNPLAAANLNYSAPVQQFVPTITWRLDHNFNEDNKAYLRYTSNMQSYQYYGGWAATNAADGIPWGAASNASTAPTPNFASAAGYTHVFSPTFYSETVVSQQWFSQYSIASGNPHRHYESELGLPNNFGQSGFPQISGFVMAHNGNQYYYGISQIISNLDENFVKTLGRHQLYFGGRYRHERLGYQPDQSQDYNQADALSTALYDTTTNGPQTGNYGALANTGANSADAFMGSFYNFSSNPLPPYTHFSNQEFDAYFQDNFHVARNLTVNLGLRWEDHPAMNSGGIGVSIDMANHGLVLENPPSYYIAKGLANPALITNLQNIGANIETPQQAGFPNALMESYPFTFGPRGGFAWQPFGEKRGTVVRGGYGRFVFPEAVRNLIALARNIPFFQGYSYNHNSVAQGPDGIQNYELRNPQSIFLGQNTANLVNTNATNAVLPGIGSTFLNPNFPPEYVTETNFTVEQPFKDNSVLRINWNYTHGQNLTHAFYPNSSPGAFIWQYSTGTPTPSGAASAIGTCQYASTGMNPWDCKTFGNFQLLNRSGWSNNNALQVNYQRLFHHGLAYQAIYVWQRPFRIGSNSTRESLGYPIQDFLGTMGAAPGASYAPLAGEGPMTQPVAPPPLPKGAVPWADYKALRRFEDYKTDPYFSTLFHHLSVNGIWELPFGRGKRFLGNSNRFVDELVGGWQIAGDGQMLSSSFAPAAANWGQNTKLVLYKHKYPIVDCSSGKCFNRFMWFNGYISPKFLPPANGGICTTNCVTGLPADYLPYQVPINNNPNIAANFGNNNVSLTVPTLNGGAPFTIGFAPDANQNYAGNNAFSKSVLRGPYNYNVDLSVFKVFPITEKMNVRVNVDAFNAFNIQGYGNPNVTSGEQSVSPGGIDGGSYWAARQMQLTMRFTF